MAGHVFITEDFHYANAKLQGRRVQEKLADNSQRQKFLAVSTKRKKHRDRLWNGLFLVILERIPVAFRRIEMAAAKLMTMMTKSKTQPCSWPTQRGQRLLMGIDGVRLCVEQWFAFNLRLAIICQQQMPSGRLKVKQARVRSSSLQE